MSRRNTLLERCGRGDTEAITSLRATISGFRFERMQRLLGSGERGVLLQLADKSDGEFDFDDPLGAEPIIERAIVSGVPFPQLYDENSDHVRAAIALAHLNQTHFDIHADDWKADAFWSLARDASDWLDVQSQLELNYFCNGRALFGKRIATNWSYYGYLLLDEHRHLGTALEELQRRAPSFAKSQHLGAFVKVLAGWFDSLDRVGLDLWFSMA